MRRLQWGAATLIALAAVTAGRARAQTIDTRNVDASVWGGNGIYGQTFTVGPSQTTLTSYSLWVGANDVATGGVGPYSFYSQLYLWDGSTIVGGPLYTSGVLAAPCCDPAVPPRVDFAVGAVPLTSGSQYLALIARTTEGGLDLGYVRLPSGFGDSYAGGRFVGGSSGTGAPDPATASYFPIAFAPGNDLMFVAEFGTSTVPEPATLALCGAGLCALGLLRRGRRG